MPGKIIEISCNTDHVSTIASLAENSGVRVLSRYSSEDDADIVLVRLYVETDKVQAVLDQLQTFLKPESGALILLSPVDARIGLNHSLVESDMDVVIATREEIFSRGQ